MTLPGPGRFPYSAIVDRPDFDWPGGKRLAVYIALNLEHFAFGEGLGAELAPGGPQPDVLNWAWREYGNRVGVWRMLDLFRQYEIPLAILVNSEIYDHCPEVMDAFRARGDEVVGHGRANAERQGILSEAEENTLIKESTGVLTEQEGRPPKGWLGPWIPESAITPDLLEENGYEYVLDWCMDDQPIWMKTRSGGRILSIPYAQELNDIPQIVARKLEGEQFADMVVSGFKRQMMNAEKQPIIFSVCLHAYLMGQAHRLESLERILDTISRNTEKTWLTRPGDIALAFKALSAK